MKKLTLDEFIKRSNQIHNNKFDYSKSIYKNVRTKIIYEFNGDFWHGNPKIYNENDINPVNKKTLANYIKNL